MSDIEESISERQHMRFIGVTKDATTAGPGKRLELFLKGCIRGIVNPCEGCFNPSTWEFGGDRKRMHINEVVEMIDRDAWNRQVTFCGGEPLLQTRNLIEVCRELKRRDPRIHIVVYTAYLLENLLSQGVFYRLRGGDEPAVQETLLSYSAHWNPELTHFQIATADQIRELMGTIDILVDGDYQSKHRIPTEKYMNEGMFIGSSNQRVIDTQETLRWAPQFVFDYADVWMEKHLIKKHCKCCGHPINNRQFTYCDSRCRKAFHKRQKDIAVFR
ncbi:4Fe-4S cluster-binding domain-containing protein (plasmid) [Paenibacillus rhizovicinus]|uniref:4Fe-4S cluster-binding domain-containing protein n=1 Tax=Paenibacillus rhizovicinus TaxID=2704463 RepID=A0A6C0PBI8_9BACL|nr:4Fe-4S cluster-binding domain-containing protein [Paenibacillus rhizovicinus]QHW35761.1 4Fe-4S cluster-binding domain-containing protein [Paenibacillus rhizovicinus]